MLEIDKGIDSKNIRGIASIYDRYASVMYGVALKIVKNHASAEKVLNQAFSQLKENDSTFDVSNQNTCLNLVNVVRKIARDNPDLTINNSITDNQKIDVSDYEKNNHLQILNGTVAPIQQTQKAILDDVFFGNETISSAATKLGIDEREAMKLLRETICQIRTINEKRNGN